MYSDIGYTIFDRFKQHEGIFLICSRQCSMNCKTDGSNSTVEATRILCSYENSIEVIRSLHNLPPSSLDLDRIECDSPDDTAS